MVVLRNTYLKYLFIFIPTIVYFIVVHKYAVNIPSQDDYDAILNFLLRHQQAHGIDKFLLLFAQHGEHRILSSRIVYVTYNSIFGGVNFRNLIFIGNIQLLLTFMMLVVFIKRCLPKYWMIASFVAGLSLFDLNNWENADFAMAAMQNYGVVFLFMLSLLLYSSKNKKYLVPAMVIQLVCTYSSGNGMVASAFIVLYNLLHQEKLRMYASSILFIFCTPLYFVHYAALQSGHAPTHIVTIVTYFFRFISNHIYYGDKISSLIAGILLLVGLAFVLPRNKMSIIQNKSLPLICLTGFIITTIGLTAVFRSGLGDYIASRYLIYPHLLIGLLFVFLLIRLQHHKAVIPAAGLFTVIILIAYNMNFRGGVRDFEQLNHTLKITDYYYPDKQVAKAISEQSCQMHIYCPIPSRQSQ